MTQGRYSRTSKLLYVRTTLNSCLFVISESYLKHGLATKEFHYERWHQKVSRFLPYVDLDTSHDRQSQLILIFLNRREIEMKIEISEKEATFTCILCKQDPCTCLKELI